MKAQSILARMTLSAGLLCPVVAHGGDLLPCLNRVSLCRIQPYKDGCGVSLICSVWDYPTKSFVLALATAHGTNHALR